MWWFQASFMKADRVRSERAHLADGDGVEFGDAVAMGKAHVDELGIEALQIGEDEELLDGGVIGRVAIKFQVGIAPLPSGEAEEGNVREIGLESGGDSDLSGREISCNLRSPEETKYFRDCEF